MVERRIVKVACGSDHGRGTDAWLLFRLKGEYKYFEKVRVTVERIKAKRKAKP